MKIKEKERQEIFSLIHSQILSLELLKGLCKNEQDLSLQDISNLLKTNTIIVDNMNSINTYLIELFQIQ